MEALKPVQFLLYLLSVMDSTGDSLLKKILCIRLFAFLSCLVFLCLGKKNDSNIYVVKCYLLNKWK